MELLWNSSPFVLVCLVLSFILSGMEAGVFALSPVRIRQQAKTGRRSAQALSRYLERPENFLWTILVGNTVANFFIIGWLVVSLHGWLGEQVLVFSGVFLTLTFLFYALFDLLPKMLFRTFPNRLCLWLARPFGVVHLLLRPLVFVVEWFSGMLLRWRGGTVFTGRLFGDREELRVIMQESAQTLSDEERVMISKVLDLQSLTVRMVMMPLNETVTVNADTPLREVLRLARERRLNRLPVWEKRDGRQRIKGLVSVSALLYTENLDPEQSAASVVKPAMYLEEDARLETALRRMQRSGQRLAVVVGRDQRETGIISLQDILRRLFGEVTS